MQTWELIAREQIRDLVARYNANGDAGRFDDVVALFGRDSVLELEVDGVRTELRGPDEIRALFEQTRDRWARDVGRSGAPHYVRHHLTTHQIDVVDACTATGRAYFAVVMPGGLDHWGRYVDRYVATDGVWRFASRRVIVDPPAPSPGE